MIRTKQCRQIFRVAAILSVSLATFSCTASNPSGVYYASGKGSVTPDGLHRVRWEPFSVSFVKPGADLRKYNAVMIDQVTISYSRPPKETLAPADANNPNFALTSNMKKGVEKWFRRSFVSALTKSDTYKLTTTPGPDVLIVSGHLVDLQITVPSFQQQDSDETLLTNSSGSVTLVLNVNDSETNEPLVRVGQRRALTPGGDSNLLFVSDDVSTTGGFHQLFQVWSNDLRRELDRLRSIPTIPAVPESSG